MAAGELDETSQWLNYLQPEGLVLGVNILRKYGRTPERQSPLDTEAAADILGVAPKGEREDDSAFVLRDPWRLFGELLTWPAQYVAGAPDGPAVPAELSRTLPEHGTLLEPHMALLWRDGQSKDDPVAQALVMLHPYLDPDQRGQFGVDEWEASPHQRLERLLRETNVGTGILIARNTLRLVHAPRGETAGWITWPLAALGRVEGRPMLAGLKTVLGRNAFWTGAKETRLRNLLKESREAQNEVSEKLSSQVLEALYELLRGMHRADPTRIEALADSDAHHLYEGLLTCLMRLVFLLYAEDRDLLPTHKEDGLGELWEQGYSIKTLYSRLLDDEALNPDTMDERRGAWGQLLAVFRLIHDGYSDWVARRGGKLFDPDAFPFLEGRDKGTGEDAVTVLPVSDGTILRILHGLMTIEGHGLDNQRVRERLSYRSLDVESIGSVYETVMGFTAMRAQERMIALRDEKKLPNFIGLETLLAQKPAERQKWLKEQSIKLSTKQNAAVKDAADVEGMIVAFGSAVDERASPKATAIGNGTPYLQPTDERRRSGSHYTPRSLTEPIVRHALATAFERIGVDASPEAVLSLKVLDPACGSGAFLVEACRQLGARLEQAWDMHKAEKPTIPTDEDEVIHARRLVAQRCLYGVDRNPMAVDLARLSLWLATLAREHEFTFLDHAIKSGDSLVGLTQHEIEAANWDASKPGLPYIRMLLKDRLHRVIEGREAIRGADDNVARAVQEARHHRVEDQLEPVREIGDAVIACFFSAEKPKARELERQKVESLLAAPIGVDQSLIGSTARRFRTERRWRPFHWEIEFPEVFARENPGFDAIVGNPPFLGGAKIWAALGPAYPDWLRSIHKESGGKAVDLVAHFFRRAFFLCREGGSLGLLATKTVAEGDTRLAGLVWVIKHDGFLRHVRRNFPWPGEASVVVSSIVISKGVVGPCTIDGRPAVAVNSQLFEGGEIESPLPLRSNANKAFRGADTYGLGFIFADEGKEEHAGTTSDALRFRQRTSNLEVLLPYIGGDEVTSSPTHQSARWAINFRDMSLVEAQKWPELLSLVEEKVKPKRANIGGYAVAERRKKFWWQYGTDTPALRAAIAGYDKVLAISQTTAHIAFARLPRDVIFSQKLIVIAPGTFGATFAIMQSRVHMLWALRWGSRQGETPVYSPPECFETFPFPPAYESDRSLEAVGQAYHDYRGELMIAADEGMTKTYNRFHAEREAGSAIQRLRELHGEMDRAVLRAYGWDDLADTLQPEFLTEETEDDYTYQGRYFWPAAQRDQVLARLLTLNSERYEEELKAGLHEKGQKRARSDDGDDLNLDGAND